MELKALMGDSKPPSIAKILTFDEARRIAVNVAKLPSSGAFMASAKVPKRDRDRLRDRLGIPARHGAKQDQLQQLVVGEGVGAR